MASLSELGILDALVLWVWWNEMGPEDRFLKVFLELFFLQENYISYPSLNSLPPKKWHHLRICIQTQHLVGSDLYDTKSSFDFFCQTQGGRGNPWDWAGCTSQRWQGPPQFFFVSEKSQQKSHGFCCLPVNLCFQFFWVVFFLKDFQSVALLRLECCTCPF